MVLPNSKAAVITRQDTCMFAIWSGPDILLSGRHARIRYCGEDYRRGNGKGCVQGYIGGSIFVSLNLLINPLLKEFEARSDYAQAFADDVVLVFAGVTALEIEERAIAAVEHVKAWRVANKLKFLPHKTRAKVMTRKRKFDDPTPPHGVYDDGRHESDTEKSCPKTCHATTSREIEQWPRSLYG
ncbi:unnamed protein product [Euphydryas editha]|uniref:Reverse transcriptase domain-containing protein n=1 Tax=Euphydryas editha TaxID=104508 RepID=A0AAU9TWM7_EUPED|nr:unnamed protein product [Euphydryas editha]